MGSRSSASRAETSRTGPKPLRSPGLRPAGGSVERGFARLDTGMPDSPLEVGAFLRVFETRHGSRIAGPEEIALSQNRTDERLFRARAERTGRGAQQGS